MLPRPPFIPEYGTMAMFIQNCAIREANGWRPLGLFGRPGTTGPPGKRTGKKVITDFPLAVMT